MGGKFIKAFLAGLFLVLMSLQVSYALPIVTYSVTGSNASGYTYDFTLSNDSASSTGSGLYSLCLDLPGELVSAPAYWTQWRQNAYYTDINDPTSVVYYGDPTYGQYDFVFIATGTHSTSDVPVATGESLTGLKLHSSTLITSGLQFLTAADMTVPYLGGDETSNNGSGTNPEWVGTATMTSYVSSVPEPSTLLITLPMLGSGLLWAVRTRRRREE